MTPPNPPPEYRWEQKPGGLVLRLAGEWRMDRGVWDPAEVLAHPPLASGTTVTVQAEQVVAWDTALSGFLAGLIERVEKAGGRVELRGLPDGVHRLLALARAVPEVTPPPSPPAPAPWTVLKLKLRRLGAAVVEVLAFLGELAIGLGRLVRGRARTRAGDFWYLCQRCGADALPIVLLINLLVGMILAFVGVVQLQQFGAAIFVANLVALAVLREMGALMTGIILSGRTGAAFAAELGSMQVNEEIDAFRTFAIPPMEFLVLPRVLAMVAMMPLLTVFADAIGILGGLLVGSTMLDLSARAYWNQTLLSATLRHFLLGLAKSLVFGALIALCGCYQGLKAGRNAEAVGLAATRAVVRAITALIVADAIFAVFCDLLGI